MAHSARPPRSRWQHRAGIPPQAARAPNVAAARATGGNRGTVLRLARGTRLAFQQSEHRRAGEVHRNAGAHVHPADYTNSADTEQENKKGATRNEYLQWQRREALRHPRHISTRPALSRHDGTTVKPQSKAFRKHQYRPLRREAPQHPRRCRPAWGPALLSVLRARLARATPQACKQKRPSACRHSSICEVDCFMLGIADRHPRCSVAAQWTPPGTGAKTSRLARELPRALCG